MTNALADARFEHLQTIYRTKPAALAIILVVSPAVLLTTDQFHALIKSLYAFGRLAPIFARGILTYLLRA